MLNMQYYMMIKFLYKMNQHLINIIMVIIIISMNRIIKKIHVISYI